MQWIQKVVPRVSKKDDRVYCCYCDMKKNPRWTCRFLDRHCSQNQQHSRSLCIAPAQHIFAHLQGAVEVLVVPTGLSTRKRRQRTRTRQDSRRESPTMTKSPQTAQPPPPPAQKVSTAMDTTGPPAQQDAAPAEAAPLCAAAAAMHPPPQASSPAQYVVSSSCSVGPSKPMQLPPQEF